MNCLSVSECPSVDLQWQEQLSVSQKSSDCVNCKEHSSYLVAQLIWQLHCCFLACILAGKSAARVYDQAKAEISPLSSGRRLRFGLGPSCLLVELHQHILPYCGSVHTTHTVPVWDIPQCLHKSKNIHRCMPTHMHTQKVHTLNKR